MTDDAPTLSPQQKTTLLALSRGAIRERVRGVVSASALPLDPALQQPGAAFVTLTKGGALRGCIGFVRAVQSLAETVRHCAVAAATADPRFPPVAAADLQELQMEISALSPLRPIASIEEIRVGLHGLYVSQGGRHGLLLPQVATEYGWDRDTFLSHTCNKAGLPADSWKKPGTVIRMFSAIVFNEAEILHGEKGGA